VIPTLPAAIPRKEGRRLKRLGHGSRIPVNIAADDRGADLPA
jgi:hypothetical protein